MNIGKYRITVRWGRLRTIAWITGIISTFTAITFAVGYAKVTLLGPIGSPRVTPIVLYLEGVVVIGAVVTVAFNVQTILYALFDVEVRDGQ